MGRARMLSRYLPYPLLTIGAASCSAALRNESLAICDLFWTGDVEALAALDGGDELRSLKQRIVRAGVEPGHAAAHDFDIELACLEIAAIQVGNLKLASC